MTEKRHGCAGPLRTLGGFGGPYRGPPFSNERALEDDAAVDHARGLAQQPRRLDRHVRPLGELAQQIDQPAHRAHEVALVAAERLADDMWTKQVVAANGRMPTFDEKRHFEDVLGDRIAKYLREHEDAASNTLTVQAFRFLHQVTVGMDKGQVEVLLGPAFTTSDDAQQMANWARRHWPLIRGRADEAWGYPFGWFFYFDKGKVVAITQYLEGAPYQ